MIVESKLQSSLTIVLEPKGCPNFSLATRFCNQETTCDTYGNNLFLKYIKVPVNFYTGLLISKLLTNIIFCVSDLMARSVVVDSSTEQSTKRFHY